MATFLVLIYGDPREWDAMSDEVGQRLADGHRDLRAAAGTAVLDTRELDRAAGVVTLRADAAGRVGTTDGPFAETKEVLGGYYLIEADSRDDVVALASRLYEASAGHSGVEIRQVSS